MMKSKIISQDIVNNEELKSLINLFKANGEELLIVGGAIRDYLLNKPSYDYDLATTCLPDKMVEILSNYKLDLHQLALGSVKVHLANTILEITTLRIESGVINYRYPEKIEFVKDFFLDSLRRDFTINAIYYKDKEILDYHNGIEDLNNKVIRFIGETERRIKEDPLRILRGIRFAESMDFNILDEDEYFELSNLLIPLGLCKYQELLRILQIGKTNYLNKYQEIFIKGFPNLDFNYINNDYFKLLEYLYLKEREIFNNLNIYKETRRDVKEKMKDVYHN